MPTGRRRVWCSAGGMLTTEGTNGLLLVGATDGSNNTTATTNTACIEGVHYANVSRMSSTTSNLPQNLAHLSHFWQRTSSCL